MENRREKYPKSQNTHYSNFVGNEIVELIIIFSNSDVAQ